MEDADLLTAPLAEAGPLSYTSARRLFGSRTDLG